MGSAREGGFVVSDSGVREAADTARDLRDAIERFAAARESGDIGQQHIAKKDAAASIAALVDAAERAERLEDAAEVLYDRLEDADARIAALEVDAVELIPLLNNIVETQTILTDSLSKLADCVRARLVAAAERAERLAVDAEAKEER